MKSFSSVACLLCLVGCAVARSDDHPVGKVIKMLEGLKAKAIMEGKQEENAYQKFAYWCKDSIKTLKTAIEEQNERISVLEDLIAGKTKEKEVLEEEIETLENEIAEREAAVEKANKEREAEHKLYQEAIKDLDLTIEAVDVALEAVSKSYAKTEGGASLLQAQKQVKKVIALISVFSSTTDTQLDALSRFVQPNEIEEDDVKKPIEEAEEAEKEPLLAEGDRAAHVDVYKFKSGNVIELLKGLRLKFQDDKLKTVKEETNAANGHELAMQAQGNAIAAAKHSKDKKENTLAQVEKVLAEANAELEATQADKKADSKSLKDTTESCETKKSEWDERSETRKLEIEAMDQAMKILAKATGTTTEAPSNPVPPPNPVASEEESFLQIASFLQTHDNPKRSALAVIRQAAKDHHSRALERLAQEVSSHLGPEEKQLGKEVFTDVNNMIEQMIFRLMDEQKQEDEHKAWCDKELSMTNTMKEDKEDKVAELKAEIATQTAEVAQLTEDIKAADLMIAEIVKFKAEATEVREIGKAENKAAVEDAKLAQKAIADATAVLTDFYKESGEIAKKPWEFIQKPVELPENPATWDSSYTGVSDPDKQPTGIISVLETCMADYAKMEAETKAQEAADQKSYEQAMSDNDVEMAERKQESEMKSNEKKRRVGKIDSLNSQLKDTSNELYKTNQYLKDLQPACVTGDSTYEARKAARTQEVEALQNAQKILEDAFNKEVEEVEATNAVGFLRRHSH
jgi:hypothetical protein